MILYPYYYNIPDEHGNLKVETNYLTFKEYVENVHVNPITGLSVD